MLSLKSVEEKIKNLIPDFADQTYLLAVSGGADSMVLAHIFKDLDLKFEVSHINYKLRDEDSEFDMKTVKNFCEENNITFHLYTVSEKDQKPGNSIQVWARELRYRFFREIQEKKNINFLVTAHHLNDQLETFIINLSKASGLKGLTGIPANENKILRPLLDFSKEEIYGFAEDNKIKFREDVTNKKNDYLRNNIRNNIVPQLLKTNIHFLDNFKKSIEYLSQAKNFTEEKISDFENEISKKDSDQIVLSKQKLIEAPPFVQFEIFQKYGFVKPGEIAKIFRAESGSIFTSKDFQIIIHRDTLILKVATGNSDIEKEIVLMKNFDFSKKEIIIDVTKYIGDIQINQSMDWKFDAQKITFPLKLRKQINGDIFFPKGFSGTKKVSKFLRDEKLSILDREKIWILADGKNSVLGIVPYRQDRRSAAEKNTENLLNLI